MSDQSAGKPSRSGTTARSKLPKSKGTKRKNARTASHECSIRRGVLGQRPQAIQRSNLKSKDCAAQKALIDLKLGVPVSVEGSKGPAGACTRGAKGKLQLSEVCGERGLLEGRGRC